MKAWRLKAYNEPIELEDVPYPEISDPTDVIVKIGGAGVCRTDLHLIEGVWKDALNTQLPHIIGHENAGWVEEIGPNVTEFAVGDPVIVHPVASCGKCLSCRAGEDMHCENMQFMGLTHPGGYAEYMKTSERALIKLDEGVNPEDVSPLADAGITAYRAVKKVAPLAKPGTQVLMIGMGGLGHIGVQLMREFGNADIIALDLNRERLDMALDYGADHSVLGGDDAVSKIMELSDGNGIETIIDLVGTDQTHSDSMKMLRKGGSYFVIGYGGALYVPSLDIINNEFNIIGNLVGNYNELYELMRMYAKGKVGMKSFKYPLDQADEVLNELDEGKINGRAVLVP